MTPKLDLPDAVETLLFGILADHIAADPAIRRVVKTLKRWDDSPADRADLMAPGTMPCLELWPTGGPDDYATPDTMLADLYVDVVMSVAGLRIDNAQNLWGAVVRSVRPKTVAAANAFRDRLVKEGGAETGLIRVTRPAFVTKPDAANQAYFVASGQLAVRYFSSLTK